MLFRSRSIPSLDVKIDGVTILDGDLINPQPTIKAELVDPTLVPLTDTSSVIFFLNNSRIFANDPRMNYTFNVSNPKVVATFTPTLSDGFYTLRILGKNALSYDTVEVVKAFSVMNEAALLNVYNYPNPSKGETYFTFRLTQIPEDLTIRIFTVAGRLIREINKNSAQLNYDFNRIFWDGRDADGDLVANGTYIYRVTMRVADKTLSTTEKVTIVR